MRCYFGGVLSGKFDVSFHGARQRYGSVTVFMTRKKSEADATQLASVFKNFQFCYPYATGGRRTQEVELSLTISPF